MSHVYTVYIHECRNQLYKVPAIDNRRRNGYNMWQRVMDRYGSGKYGKFEGKLFKLDGTVVRLRFTWSGWGEVKS